MGRNSRGIIQGIIFPYSLLRPESFFGELIKFPGPLSGLMSCRQAREKIVS